MLSIILLLCVACLIIGPLVFEAWSYREEQQS